MLNSFEEVESFKSNKKKINKKKINKKKKDEESFKNNKKNDEEKSLTPTQVKELKSDTDHLIQMQQELITTLKNMKKML